jgi:integrase
MRLPKGIRLRGGKFHVDVSKHGAGRHTGTFDTIEAAALKQAEWKAAISKGATISAAVSPKRGGWTVGEAVIKTFAVAWAGSKSERVLRHMANRVLDYWGKTRPLDTIKTPELDEWVEKLKASGLSDATINRNLAFVSKLFTVAIPRGGATAKPKFPRRKEYNGRIRFLSDGEERRILDLLVQWGDDESHDAVVVLLDTGLRTGELMRLEARDVDLNNNAVTAWGTKNDLSRTIPLTVRARAILAARAEQHTSGRLFPSGYWKLRLAWDRARSHMGLAEDEQFVLHTLRHTFCSRLVQRGVSITVVKQLAGHKTIAITMRYAHLAPGDLAKAIERLEA